MRIVTQNDLVNELTLGLKNTPRRSIVDYTDFQVNYGFDAKPNFEYCKQHNIPCVDIGRRGGAFAVNKGDIGLGCVEPGLDTTTGQLFYKNVTDHLKCKGLNVEAVDNDILIDGFKVFGWASHYYEEQNATFITCHFTMSVDLDFIKNVCTKPLNKIPKGLSEYGITREEIIELITKQFEE